VNLTKTLLKKEKGGGDLKTALPTAKADISILCYKNKHFTYNFTVCDRQMEALGVVQCYLWHGVRANLRFC
jgi:hypothetical protein